jgi:NADPH:quinone reductase-like Zn-dependent oxidoreductase
MLALLPPQPADLDRARFPVSHSGMKRVAIPRHGGVDVLVLGEAPPPPLVPGGVRIRVQAAGVNFADLLMRMGMYAGAPPLPFIPGYEVAGTVLEGPGFPPGARVLAVTRFGGYAAEVVTPASKVFPLPEAWSFAEGAAFPVVTLTAWAALSLMARVRADDRVLVHGIAGGVGLAALQIARARGARVAGTCRGDEKAERVRGLGAEVVFDPRRPGWSAALARWAPEGVDVILEPRGLRALRQGLDGLAPGGRAVLYGASEMVPRGRRERIQLLRALPSLLALNPLALLRRNVGLYGLDLLRLWDREAVLAAAFEELWTWVQEGRLRPVLDRTFPLQEVGEAHRYLHDRRNFGKVVLTLDGEESR